MKKIFKYLIEAPVEVLELPRDPEFLHIGSQYGKIVLWAIVDTSEVKMEKHEILVYATGQEVIDRQKLLYLGTVQMPSPMMELVWHVFRRGVP